MGLGSGGGVKCLALSLARRRGLRIEGGKPARALTFSRGGVRAPRRLAFLLGGESNEKVGCSTRWRLLASEDRVLRRRILVEIFVAGKVDDPLAREHRDRDEGVNLDVTLAARQIKQRVAQCHLRPPQAVDKVKRCTGRSNPNLFLLGGGSAPPAAWRFF